MEMDQLLDLCRRSGYELAQKSGWMQVGPPGSVGPGTRDPRVFYVSPRYVDLRRSSGPVDFIDHAIAAAPLVGNGQIVARVPYSLFSDAEWERFVAHNASVATKHRSGPQPAQAGSGPTRRASVAALGARGQNVQKPAAPSRTSAAHRVVLPAASGGSTTAKPTHEDMLAATIAEMAELLSTPVASPEDEYLDDLVPSLLELADCLAGHYRCRIAAICLSGKILEICLQRILVREKQRFEELDALYQLVERVRRARIRMPTGWEDAANLVRLFRNGAIHQRRGNPVPSTEHVTMVVMAVTMILRDAFSADLSELPM